MLEEGRKMQALIVTTAHRGVFFGYGEPTDAPVITLERARMCVHWPAENRGVVGLASDGPKKGARIGPAAPKVILRDVTAIFFPSEQAIKAWESAPWT